MSFNRGKKRDNYGGGRNYNDRHMGGGGGPMGGNIGRNNSGNNMGGRGGMGGGVNPWESGVMPGRGILPTPSNLNFASPQAQLALANNLLSNLLCSQQDNQPQVPSLLSLGNNFGGPGPNFGNQQSFQNNRFNDRTMRHSMKNQRTQPYNKMGNRGRDGVAGRRGPSSASRASGSQHMNGNQSQHRNDKSSKINSASKQNQSAKREHQDAKTSDKTIDKSEVDVKSKEETDEKVDKANESQDIKMEVDDGEKIKLESGDVSQTEGDKKDDGDKKGDKSPVKGSVDKDNRSTGKKSETRHAESRYADVPMSHMFCHVCNKHMWDGSSFENHLRGRAHQLMMDKLDESYKLKVDLMRHELRVAEEQRELTLNNSKRRGKKVSVDLNVRDYCTMCDLNFYGTLSSHRKSEKHQSLKTFLHPRCTPCSKEFPSRIEFDEHCLTPTHMKNAVQSDEMRKNKRKDKLAKGEVEVRNAEEEDKDVGPEGKDKLDDSQKESDNENYLTDLVEELSSPNVKIPNYKYCRQNQVIIGRSMVKDAQGFYCEKCRRFMLNEEDMNSHLRTITHYRNFVQEAKILISNAEEAVKKAAEEAAAQELREQEESNRFVSCNDDDGNFKRRKTDGGNKDNTENEETEDEFNQTQEFLVSESADLTETDCSKLDESEQVLNDSTKEVETKKTPGPKSKDDTKKSDKYDPMEADADDLEEDEEETVTESNIKNDEDEDMKKTDEAVEKLLDDIDMDENEGPRESRNLVDDTEEEKQEEEENTSKVEEVNKSVSRGRGFYRQRGNRARRSRR